MTPPGSVKAQHRPVATLPFPPLPPALCALVRLGARGKGGGLPPKACHGPGNGNRIAMVVGAQRNRESNLEVDALPNIVIDLRPGNRVEPRERPDHEASSSRFVTESESNPESDQPAPVHYDIGLATAGVAAPGGTRAQGVGREDGPSARRDKGSGRWAGRRPQRQAR
jgi:hypothetical protein